jgi:D-alanine-D-alanine ligase-like ATP-grasp enzyme
MYVRYEMQISRVEVEKYPLFVKNTRMGAKIGFSSKLTY